MLKDNIINLRNFRGYSQEDVAEKIGISRQAYAKWEKGETTPDIEKCAELAKLYETSIDALYQDYDVPDEFSGGEDILPAPKGKHIFGTVTINEKGQIVIPKKARDIMGYKPGDNLIVLGDEESGLALMKSSDFMRTMFSLIKAAKKKN
ncbi:MAG: helix-turn-helix domain-containing protein [Treponema sp.]|nr:helix-turn-helix domain-containing protein [Treponema sp.]